MKAKTVSVGFAVLAVVAALVGFRYVRDRLAARDVPGGVLMANAAIYDRLSHRLLGSMYRGIAADVAAAAIPGAAILEVGCGPGHLAVDLARNHGLDVTGVDLDPDMIDHARANSARDAADGDRRPTFLVGDAAALPFADDSFDLVIATFSLHHWADPTGGLTEIARVLRPGGRALLWDFPSGTSFFHPEVPDPEAQVEGSPLRVVSVDRWKWPGPISLCSRLELSH